MIERLFVSQKIKEFQIQQYISDTMKNVGHSHTKVMRTPLGEKIVIYASRPGLIVGRKGQNIKRLTLQLKKMFNLENPQIEISEVENVFLDPQIVAEMIATSLEMFGSARFKGVGHKIMTDVMSRGALGVEVLISGKLPSARAKTWRFYQGYMKNCGQIAKEEVLKGFAAAQLKSGTVGVRVKIMPPTVKLPDDIELRTEDTQPVVQELTPEGTVKSETPLETKTQETGNAAATEKKPKKVRKKSKEKDAHGQATAPSETNATDVKDTQPSEDTQ